MPDERLKAKLAEASGLKLINEVPFMRIVSVVLMLAGILSSSASAAPSACELISLLVAGFSGVGIRPKATEILGSAPGGGFQRSDGAI
jgi:hypothetical protein